MPGEKTDDQKEGDMTEDEKDDDDDDVMDDQNVDCISPRPSSGLIMTSHIKEEEEIDVGSETFVKD